MQVLRNLVIAVLHGAEASDQLAERLIPEYLDAFTVFQHAVSV